MKTPKLLLIYLLTFILPAAKDYAAQFSSDALKNFASKYGERFCSKKWLKGTISCTVKKICNKSWDW